MKKELTAIISGIKRSEIHDGDGMRTTVFFKGCPLRCLWCHNPESISQAESLAHFGDKCIGCGCCTEVCKSGAVTSGVIDRDRCTACGECAKVCPTEAMRLFGETVSVDALYRRLIADRPFFGKVGGVTLSGGECLMQADAATALSERLYESGISVNIDTCGYTAARTLDAILPYADTFLYDVKAISPEVHKKCTGRDNSLILDNLAHLSSRGAKIEIRFPLVVGYNDGETDRIGEHLAALRGIVRVKVLRYHNLAASRYQALGMRSALPEARTEEGDVLRAVEVLRRYGLNAVSD